MDNIRRTRLLEKLAAGSIWDAIQDTKDAFRTPLKGVEGEYGRRKLTRDSTHLDMPPEQRARMEGKRPWGKAEDYGRGAGWRQRGVVKMPKVDINLKPHKGSLSASKTATEGIRGNLDRNNRKRLGLPPRSPEVPFMAAKEGDADGISKGKKPLHMYSARRAKSTGPTRIKETQSSWLLSSLAKLQKSSKPSAPRGEVMLKERSRSKHWQGPERPPIKS
tara:strand:- start:143 stop:799 length:657 start_codon:yes stop_codon:yes gene_type:complete